MITENNCWTHFDSKFPSRFESDEWRFTAVSSISGVTRAPKAWLTMVYQGASLVEPELDFSGRQTRLTRLYQGITGKPCYSKNQENQALTRLLKF